MDSELLCRRNSSTRVGRTSILSPVQSSYNCTSYALVKPSANYESRLHCGYQAGSGPALLLVAAAEELVPGASSTQGLRCRVRVLG